MSGEHRSFKLLCLWLLALLLIIGEFRLLDFLNSVIKENDRELARMETVLSRPLVEPPIFVLTKPSPPPPFTLQEPPRTGDRYLDAQMATAFRLAQQRHYGVELAYRAALDQYNQDRQLYERQRAAYEKQRSHGAYYRQNRETLLNRQKIYNALGIVSIVLLAALLITLRASAAYLGLTPPGRSATPFRRKAALAMLGSSFVLLLGNFLFWFYREKNLFGFLDQEHFRGRVAIACLGLAACGLVLFLLPRGKSSPKARAVKTQAGQAAPGKMPPRELASRELAPRELAIDVQHQTVPAGQAKSPAARSGQSRKSQPQARSGAPRA